MRRDEKVFRALAEQEKKRQWYGGETCEKFEMEFRVGGAERALYRMGEETPFPGAELVMEGQYLDIVPNERVVMASAMSLAGRRISASLVTFELAAADDGTDLICTHQDAFFAGADGPELRKAGWNTLLDRLVELMSASGE